MINLKYGFFIMRRKTKEENVENVIKIQGDIFDFTKFNATTQREYSTCICKKCGHEWDTTFDSLLHNHGCPKCSGSLPFTVDEFKNKAKEIFGNEKYDYSLIDEIKGNEQKLPIICHEKDKFGKEHGIFNIDAYHHIYRKQGCAKCNKGVKKDENFFLKEMKEIYGDEYEFNGVSKYVNSKTRVNFICKSHGLVSQTPPLLLHYGGCPFCSKSHLEQEIISSLNNKKINFISQHTFEWLKNKKPMSLDFFLPDYNIAIECQGEQHYRPIKFWGGETKYNERIQLDTAKKRLCDEHGIKVLYFTHYSKIQEGGDIYKDADKLLNEITKNKFIRDI